jgi:tRNA U34 5-methylaminomethyl-2-thiouridine-forming methyltransferase MnmC
MKDHKLIPQLTQDGSYTFFSQEYQEAFHSAFGAKQEAEVRYIQPCLIKQLAAKQSTIRLLDICYGLGYNSAAALEAIWAVNSECQVELIALEIAIDVPQQAVNYNLLAGWRQSPSEESASSPIPQLLAKLANQLVVKDEFLQAKLVLGDARQTIASIIQSGWQADAIFLDPFSPPKCPQLWTVEFISLVAQCLTPRGRLATYSCSAAVRTALLLAGLNIGSITGIGRKSPGTIASFEYKKLPQISSQEQEHLNTKAAIPYRDPCLQDNLEPILARRQQEQQNSNWESTSQWRKRWL